MVTSSTPPPPPPPVIQNSGEGHVLKGYGTDFGEYWHPFAVKMHGAESAF